MERLVIPVLSPAAADVIARLVARSDLTVVGVAIDVGQGVGLDAVRDLALAAGAARCHVIDRRERLAAQVLWPALRAGALDVPGAPIHTALSMSVVADTVIDIAGLEDATAVAVWTDDPGDRPRLRALVRTAAPALGLVATTRDAPAMPARNLWAQVELAVAVPPASPPRDGSRATLTIDVERGTPVGVNGVAMTPAEIVESLQTIGAHHGIAPFTIRDDAPAGATWRVDAPAALVRARAMATVASRTFDGPTAVVAAMVADAYATLVRDGAWGSAARAGLDAFVDRVLATATGAVAVQIEHGRIEVER